MRRLPRDLSGNAAILDDAELTVQEFMGLLR